ncbi:hypothetical protein [Marinicrinis sediminis]|uniref:Uncharacterized protein n=1 Tax=Marinicrinis sediminis TaxID=1652465 RepID=A0ABW5RFF3_9BACL
MWTEKQVECICWSIALPGFGQLRNGKLVKGLTLIVLEMLINVYAHLNRIIISSFNGQISGSIEQANDQWLMFYPCLYMFAMWDAYRDAGGGTKPYSVLPFAFGAYMGTVGIIYSRLWLGPVWLGLIGLAVGLLVGHLLRRLLTRLAQNQKAKEGRPEHS